MKKEFTDVQIKTQIEQEALEKSFSDAYSCEETFRRINEVSFQSNFEMLVRHFKPAMSESTPNQLR